MCVLFRSYYESSDLPSALGVVEDALARHPSLVSDDFINMAAELYIANRRYSKALQVHIWVCAKACLCHLEKRQIKGVSCLCVFSQVLVQFAGVVLVRDESKSDVAAPTEEERVADKTTEEQEKKNEDTKSNTGEEIAAEDNSESLFANIFLFSDLKMALFLFDFD